MLIYGLATLASGLLLSLSLSIWSPDWQCVPQRRSFKDPEHSCWGCREAFLTPPAPAPPPHIPRERRKRGRDNGRQDVGIIEDRRQRARGSSSLISATEPRRPGRAPSFLHPLHIPLLLLCSITHHTERWQARVSLNTHTHTQQTDQFQPTQPETTLVTIMI